MYCFYIIGDPTKTRVKFKCRETCAKYLPRLCGGETVSPSVVPSVSESVSMPPSSSPTRGCVDDDSFEFEIASGEMKDCTWLGESEGRIDAYCESKIVGTSSCSIIVLQISFSMPFCS